MPGVEEADPATVKAMLDNGEAVLIDVREDAEVAQFRIPGAQHIAMSRFDPERIPDLEGRKLVLHCAAGMRSDAIARELLSRGLYEEITNMVGGIQAWAQAGFEVES